MIYHDNHNKCYYFTNRIELRLVPFTTLLFDTKFVLCKDTHLNISKCRMPNCKEETPPQSHKMKVSTSTCTANDSDKNWMFAVNEICKKTGKILNYVVRARVKI